jgi:hypothetical protein
LRWFTSSETSKTQKIGWQLTLENSFLSRVMADTPIWFGAVAAFFLAQDRNETSGHPCGTCGSLCLLFWV